MGLSVQEITQKVEREFAIITQVVEEVNKVMVGQRNMIDKLLI